MPHFCLWWNDGDDGVSLRPPSARSRHHVAVHSVVLVFLRLPLQLDGCDVGVQHIILDQTQLDAGVVELPILILSHFLGRRRRVFRTGLDLSEQTEEAVENSEALAGRFFWALEHRNYSAGPGERWNRYPRSHLSSALLRFSAFGPFFDRLFLHSRR